MEGKIIPEKEPLFQSKIKRRLVPQIKSHAKQEKIKEEEKPIFNIPQPKMQQQRPQQQKMQQQRPQQPKGGARPQGGKPQGGKK